VDEAVEATNALLLASRRRRISERWAARSIEHCLRLPVALDTLDSNAAFRAARIAAAHSLTVYDACYVELAQRLRAPLATLDQAFVRAAPALKLKIWK
jgi:predicted nucleic acid-binding protein